MKVLGIPFLTFAMCSTTLVFPMEHFRPVLVELLLLPMPHGPKIF